LALNVLFTALLHRYRGWHYVRSQILTTMITMLWDFSVHRRWTFSARRAPVAGGN
jgi:putative flippase GtrA